MDDREFARIRAGLDANRLVVGVDRVFARKVYTELPAAVLKDVTGEPAYFEIFVTRFCFTSPGVFLLASCVFAVLAFGWLSLLAIPILAMVYFVTASRSSAGGSRVGHLVLVALGVGACVWWNVLPLRWSGSCLGTLAIALILHRLAYIASASFFWSMVTQNATAWEYFRDGVVIRDVAQSRV